MYGDCDFVSEKNDNKPRGDGNKRAWTPPPPPPEPKPKIIVPSTPKPTNPKKTEAYFY